MASLKDSLAYQPAELKFGTSGLRGLVTDMTDLECYINTVGFLQFLKDNDQIGDSIIYLAGDLRQSTPRILRAVQKAILDADCQVVYCGRIPTPALAYHASLKQAPCIMVTGSHIPDDRNGIKFYKADGEVLKSDEAAIKTAVASARQDLYEREVAESGFDVNGALTDLPELSPEDTAAAEEYLQRYTQVFGADALAGKKVVFYQHSAVGRDLLVTLLEQLGATVVPVGRSEKFIPIDTENVTPDDQAYFKQLAAENPDAFAIVSTDGDSDRPFVVDENGVFNRGDVLGAVVADWLQADDAAFPVTVSDAVTEHLDAENVPYQLTKVGSPYVIVAMQEALANGKERVVGWEVNGGVLLGSDVTINGQTLAALPTRDAVLPIIVALVAASVKGQKVSELFQQLPQRFTQAGLIDNFPTEVSQEIVARFSTNDDATKQALGKFFSPEQGFSEITEINALDGVRIIFTNGDIAHLRPSGNAPQLRIYSVADTQERADAIVAEAIAEPNGIFRNIEKHTTS